MKLGSAFGIHEQALKMRSYRAELLASNMANADTPGYKARDIDFKQAMGAATLQQPQMKTTHQNHISSATSGLSPAHLRYRIPTQPSLDGNTVDMQVEKSAFAANALEYEASLGFLNGKIKGLKKAIRGD